MIIESRLDKAIKLATDAHRGQFDKGGAPYILHPLRVMLACEGEDARIAAVLHDTVEDGGVELSLISHLLGSAVANAVNALTRREGESYQAFIDRCALNEIAIEVKLADLADNMNLQRLGREPTGDDYRRHAKYADAENTLMMARLMRAQAIEARSDKTGTGLAVGESAVRKDAPKGDHHGQT
jgi:(p)ppGpp synthase/HD superfamily hydrolase